MEDVLTRGRHTIVAVATTMALCVPTPGEHTAMLFPEVKLPTVATHDTSHMSQVKNDQIHFGGVFLVLIDL